MPQLRRQGIRPIGATAHRGPPITGARSNRTANRFSNRHRTTTTQGHPLPVQQTPGTAPVAVAPAPPPGTIAGLEGFQNFRQFSASIDRRTAGGQVEATADPFAGVQATLIPGRRGFVRDPFNPETGAHISQADFDRIQAQSAILHRPSDASLGKQFSDRFLGGRAGAEGQDIVPMDDILTGRAKGADQVALNQPHTVDNRVLTVFNKEKSKVRREFSEAMTRNQGDFDFDDLRREAENLGRNHPNHRQFIGNMLQAFIKKDPNLKAEFDQFKQTGSTASTGNATFQQLPREQQARFSDAIEAALDEEQRILALPEETRAGAIAGGSVPPEFLEALGFVKTETEGFQKITFGGELARLTPRDIIDAAQRRFGLGGAAPEPIPEAPLPTTLTQGAAPVPPRITEIPGIEGVRSGALGHIVTLTGGTEITTESAPEFIADLEENGQPPQLAFAAALRNEFGINVAQSTAPVPLAADATTTTTTVQVITGEERAQMDKQIKKTEEGKTGLLRTDSKGDILVWNPVTQDFIVAVQKQTLDELASGKLLTPTIIQRVIEEVKAVGDETGRLVAQITTATEDWLRTQRAAADKKGTK